MTVRTRAELNSDADTALPDQLLGQISAEDIRQRVKDLADSAALPAEDQDWSGAQHFAQVSGVSTEVPASNIDCSAGNFFWRIVNGNRTFTVSAVPGSGSPTEFISYGFTLKMIYSSGTITWFSGVQWVNETEPTWTAGKTYLVMFHTDNGGGVWRAAAMEFAS